MHKAAKAANHKYGCLSHLWVLQGVLNELLDLLQHGLDASKILIGDRAGACSHSSCCVAEAKHVGKGAYPVTGLTAKMQAAMESAASQHSARGASYM